MAYWGIAHALGPNYNKPWDAFDEAEFKSVLSEAYEVAAKAVALLDGVTDMEQALIRTLPFRYHDNQKPTWSQTAMVGHSGT